MKEKLNITEKEIKEIAEWLDCGLLVFLHKKTGEIVSLPEDDGFADFSMDEWGWGPTQKKIDDDPEAYWGFEKFSSRESFEVMQDFADQLTHNRALQAELLTVLTRKKPFRNFKHIIDNYGGPHRMEWFRFKAQRMMAYVKEQLDFYLTETED